MGNRDGRRQGGIDDAAEDGGLGETALQARRKRARRCLSCEGGGSNGYGERRTRLSAASQGKSRQA